MKATMSSNLVNQSIHPIHLTETASQPINLYQGRMRLIDHGKDVELDIEGIGEIEFKWFPEPGIRYAFECDSHINHDVFRHDLELSDLNTSAKAVVEFSSSGHRTLVKGRLKSPVIIGSSQEISCLGFNIANFHDYIGGVVQNSSYSWTGRLSLTTNTWIVTIDSLEPVLRKRLLKSLKDDGGYAITHTANLEKVGGEPFAPEEALEILEGLSYFLSFIRGMWIGPLLSVGFDLQKNCVWEQWNFYKISPYKEVMSWFPTHERGQDLSKLFSCFMDRWSELEWRDPLKILVHWYVESNLQAGAIEGSMIMTQAAFELLFDLLLNQSSARVKADEKLKRLLEYASLPTNLSDIPCDIDTLKGLREFAAIENKDAPKVITEVRNRITHPVRKRDELAIVHPLALRREVWRLGLWYLELFLLYWLGYEGRYNNRMKFNWGGDYDESPWLKPMD